MSQLPKKVQVTPKPSAPIGRSVGGDSVHDKMVNNKKIDTLTTNTSTYRNTIKDNARRGVESAAGESIKSTAGKFGASSGTGDDLVNIAKYGKGAKDSLFSLATKGIDSIFGTNTNGLLNELVPGFRATSTEPAPAGLGKASSSSIASKMNLRDDPLLNFSWDVQLPRLPTLPDLDMSIFNYYVEDVSLSLPFFNSEPVFRNGSFIYYPKFQDAGTLSITFYEDINLLTTSYLQAWHYLIQNPDNGKYNRPSFYKKQIVITPLDNANIPCGTFVIDSAWPSQRQPFMFSSGQSEAMKVTCEFALNKIYFKPFEKRAEMLAARRAKYGGISSPTIRSANLLDIISNPLEFGKSVIGLKSHKIPIKF